MTWLSRPAKVIISLSSVSFLFRRRTVSLLFLIAPIATSLSSKNLLSAYAIAKPSFFTATRTISLSFLKSFGKSFKFEPFFLTNSKALILLILFYLLI